MQIITNRQAAIFRKLLTDWCECEYPHTRKRLHEFLRKHEVKLIAAVESAAVGGCKKWNGSRSCVVCGGSGWEGGLVCEGCMGTGDCTLCL